ncbi:maternal embryonic leucine zipper kinase-like [Dendroctonus ponderosae]|nr:maternal embryonic leucine zipper kinase [Dendroctonus ponderosae]XP_048524939.1 maternal embryonic leucine zipper kinase-like [Dendroctonus ponderosae]
MVRYSALKGLYETEKTIGCGGFAKVKLATHLATGEKVAIKIMDKKMLGDDLHRVSLELQALKHLKHDNICQLYQVIETESQFFIIMEYCSGGELFDHIVEKNRLSESESRMFFRQIVSAVAYLHSVGYAHRDLKPENVLLDKQQNLKLIDFGLCAKPEGGMENPLHTSCGSPTYAAPELILGQQYLGCEVDVWAMGVLLYTLLTGSLPFDDLSIDNLYRKILNGKYHEPDFISKESKNLIRSMLQVEPSKRIKVSKLLNHSWLTLGVLEPVSYRSKNSSELDSDCVQSMGKFINLDETSMRNELSKWKFDYGTVTYFLLLNRKKNGQSLRLNSTYGWKLVRNPDINVPLLELPVNVSNRHNLTPHHRQKLESPGNLLSPKPQTFLAGFSPSRQFLEAKHVACEAAGRKAAKRPRSFVLEDSSPVPSKKLTPRKETPFNTPDAKKSFTGSNDTPGSARRMLGSLERSLHKVRHVLTPKKPLHSISSGPVVLNSKELCNVSTTQCKDPEFVIAELSKALEKKGIVCTRKGFRLKGCLEPNTLDRLGGCSFELEICFLPELGVQQLTPAKSILKRGLFNKSLTNSKSINASEGVDRPSEVGPGSLVGIRRKRLKGDSWCYKRVCEQVLALTSTGLQAKSRDKLLESSV